ncbi:hypothetical protein [Erwinia sp.]|uniref:hypothetical protein n=1 Tax=Erwinia citreus TaxID=558 RepID=UPI00289A9EB5|nr:hypothetical protein [Erwinia sp.]
MINLPPPSLAKIASFMTLFTVLAVSASPSIGIGSMYDVLTSGTQSMTKRIYNSGDSTAFVRVDILEIDPAAKKSNQESPQKENQGNRLEKDRLIVTPLRLIIPPNGFQSVRLLWPGERSHERYFRLRFTPVMPTVNDGFGLDEKSVDKYKKEALHAGVNVLTGYGSILIAQPDTPYFNTETEENKQGDITVINKGNATVSLDEIRYCKSGNTDCSATSREFLLPGRSYTITKKADYKINYTLIEGESKKTITY